MVQGELYGSPASEQAVWPSDDPAEGYQQGIDDLYSRGGFVLGRWSHRFADGGTIGLQGFYDRLDFEDVTERATVDTLDIELQGAWYATERNHVTVGGGYRHVWDELSGKRVAYDPRSESFGKVSLFAQDEISLTERTWRVTLGAKLEYDGYSAYALQPTVRTIYSPDDAWRFWAAASGAVRTPSRVDRHLHADVTPLSEGELFPGQPAGYVRLMGDEQIDSEELISYEVGMRTLQANRVILDVSLFYNAYDELIMLTSEKNLGAPYMDGGYFILPSQIDNIYSGSVYGGELNGELRATESWRLVGGVSYVKMDMDGPEADTEEIAATTPEWSAHLRSLLNVGPRGECDLLFYYVDQVPYLGVGSYVRTDIRLGWHLDERTELSVVGQNLFEGSQREHYEPTFGRSSHIERSVYARVAYRF